MTTELPVDPLALVRDIKHVFKHFAAVEFGAEWSLVRLVISGKDAEIHIDVTLETAQVLDVATDLIGAAIEGQPSSRWWVARPDKMQWSEDDDSIHVVLHYTLEFMMNKFKGPTPAVEAEAMQAVFDFAMSGPSRKAAYDGG